MDRGAACSRVTTSERKLPGSRRAGLGSGVGSPTPSLRSERASGGEIAVRAGPQFHPRNVACYGAPMPNLATGVFRDSVGVVVVVVQNGVAPTHEEWELYLANIGGCLDEINAAGIAITDGGTPNALQRRRVNEVLCGRRARSAVVSNSVGLRSVITALRWFNPETAAFSGQNVAAALRFAGVEGARVGPVWRFVRELDRQLTPTSRIVAEASLALREAG